MVARQVHLVRHGEVHNPTRVLYGRLPGFGLSDRGHRMAEAAAADLIARDRDISALYASPLQRTQESAAPIATGLGLAVVIEERIIEPTNVFEGMRLRGPNSALKNPRLWRYLVNPFRPSWGEPYSAIARRMLAAMTDAALAATDGDVVMVSHQLPIEIVHRRVTGARYIHDPRLRRCALSSVTSFELVDPARPEKGFVEVGYADPASHLAEGAIDVGAV